jgi:beta-1,4-mannosyltransferase
MISDSDLHPDVLKQAGISIVPIPQSPAFLQTNNKLLVLLFAPLKALWQALSLYYVLGYKCKPARWMLLQNPPFIPTFAITSLIAFFRQQRLVIDWHNFGYSLYALKFGKSHPLVRLHRWYEFRGARSAYAHFTVTNAMARFLKDKAGIIAHPLHDRPPNHFQPLTLEQRRDFLKDFGPTAHKVQDQGWRLVVSATSWTPDEDFSIMLDALKFYATQRKSNNTLPSIVAVITGKGPQKEHYLRQITKMNEEGTLDGVAIHTAWLSNEDYARLLGSADLGISMHTSSSGLDLPMKVVDMFGTGLPVAGWSKFEAWPELVQEGVNGRGFGNTQELNDVLVDLFSSNGAKLKKLRQGAMKECDRRWDEEWDHVAGQVFGLS